MAKGEGEWHNIQEQAGAGKRIRPYRAAELAHNRLGVCR